jgi:hypothetical protein
MDSRFFRKYSDIVEAAEKGIPLNESRIDEGVMDMLQRGKAKLMQMFNPQDIQQIKSIVSQATGGDTKLSIANAKKVGAALMGGGAQQPQAKSAMSEGATDTPLVQKLKAAATTLGLVGGAAAMIFGGSVLGVVGIIALFISSFTASDSYNMCHSGRDV